jgi:DNA-binding LacI/PurR family transcriptional regulator
VDLGVESIRSNRFDIVSPMSPTRQTTAVRRPTLRDVARRAGVSTSTASLVFSGKGPVATATAERVRTAATELAYAGPDPLASSLRQGRVGTVAVVVEGPLRYAFHDPFALAVLDGLAEELDAAGRSMLLVAQPVEDPERALAQLATQAVDAAVFPLCGEVVNPVLDHLLARGVPVVGSGAPVHPRVAHVLTDEAAAMRLTTQHVLELGHTRVAHLSMPLTTRHATGPGPLAGWVTDQDVEQASYPDAAGRLRGFRSLAGDDAPVVQAHDLTVEAGEAAARLLLDVPAHRRPTAVVAQADLLAAGVVRAAEALGLRVPQDLTVTGFDGVDLPWLDHVLTTVDQPGAAKGRAMGRLVRRALDGRDIADEAFPVRLRVGTTSSSPPSVTR